MTKYIVNPGDKFGRWTCVEFTRITIGKKSRKAWKCRCECGEERTVEEMALVRGKSKSCGCLRNRSKECKCKTFHIKLADNVDEEGFHKLASAVICMMAKQWEVEYLRMKLSKKKTAELQDAEKFFKDGRFSYWSELNPNVILKAMKENADNKITEGKISMNNLSGYAKHSMLNIIM